MFAHEIIYKLKSKLIITYCYNKYKIFSKSIRKFSVKYIQIKNQNHNIFFP